MTEKNKRAYLMARATGRSAFARAADDVAIRLLIFAASYLFLKSRVGDVRFTLLLSLCILLLAALFMRLCTAVAGDRRVMRVRAEMKDRLLDEKFLLLPPETFEPLLMQLAGTRTPVLLQRRNPADADAILAACRAHAGEAAIAVFATGGYTDDARALSLRMPERIMLVPPEKLRRAACGGENAVSEAELERYIEAEQALDKTRKKRRGALPFLTGAPKKYLVTAVALTLLSFVSGYGLYYRMLAGLSMSIAATGVLLGRGARPEKS